MKGTNLALKQMGIREKKRHNSLKSDQDVLAFFGGGPILKLESSYKQSWAIEDEPI